MDGCYEASVMRRWWKSTNCEKAVPDAQPSMDRKYCQLYDLGRARDADASIDVVGRADNANLAMSLGQNMYSLT